MSAGKLLPKPKASKKAAPKPLLGRNRGDKLAGDQIVVTCQKPDVWKEIRKSGQHRGHRTVARKDAKAVIEKGYTNIRP